MAEGLGLDPDDVEAVRTAAVLHDMGKVGIPEKLLTKDGPLSPDEWDAMKAHVQYADDILAPVAALTKIREMIRHHHERFDGSGYPDGLAGGEIPLGARIIAIADAYDTMTSDRPYKKAHSFTASCAELERCAGTQFDPELIRVFIAAVHEKHSSADLVEMPVPTARV
jgi:HD-GYP domain-containing protein (c-di-GMP phosphodiesterase class II)